jgi:alanine racemase
VENKFLKPRVEISIDALLHNCTELRKKLLPNTGILAVVKDRAYGCGSKQITRALEQRGGVTFFAVNTFDEALFLRNSGLKSDLLILGPTDIASIKQGFEAGMVFTLSDLDMLREWRSAGIPIRFHCNIDTRMHRLGILPQETADLADTLKHSAHLRLEGLFTHLANADDPDTDTVPEQLRLFSKATATLAAQGITPDHIHYANSAGICNFPLSPCTLARPGISLYGCRPNPKKPIAADLQPILALKSKVVKIKKVPSGTPVSYGGHYVTKHETHIATIALGYGNGYPRSLSNRGELLIKGKRYRIAGTVTMDYCMVDAGPDPHFSVNDEAVAIGGQGNEIITPDDIALLHGSIAYEILCGLNPSMERTYLLDGRVYAQETGYIY